MPQFSTLDEASAAWFLHQNYLEFFTCIGDVAEAASCFSDASMLIDVHRRFPWQTPILPYVASIAARGVVTNNLAPAPSRLSQIRKPQAFAVDAEASSKMRQDLNAFRTSHSDVNYFYNCSRTELATDRIPYMRSCGCMPAAHVGQRDARASRLSLAAQGEQVLVAQNTPMQPLSGMQTDWQSSSDWQASLRKHEHDEIEES